MKSTNKIISLLLGLIMVFSVFGIVPFGVCAVAAKEIALTADKTTAAPDDTVTFTLAIGAVENMGSISTKSLIPEGLTYVEGSLTDDKATVNRVMDFFEFDRKPTMYFSNGMIIFTGYRYDDVTTTEECEILSFSCTVDDDATGTITVGIDEFKMGSAEQDKSIADQYTVVPATVTIEGETTATETTAPETAATETTAPETTATETTAPETTATETTAPETAATETTATEAHIHNIIEIPEVPATEDAEGVKAHYKCADAKCGKLFWDATGTVEITDPAELVIPKLEPAETTAYYEYYIPKIEGDYEYYINYQDDAEILRYTSTNSEVNIPSVLGGHKVTKIGSYDGYYSSVFANHKEITKVVIPNTVTTIGYRAFAGCTGLRNVTIPNSVTNIGDGAFSGCIGLASTTLPDSLTAIGSSAFSGCTGLKSITIPDSVTKIGGGSSSFSGAFSGCIGMKTVVIGKSVTSIESFVFSGCTALTSVIIPDSVTTLGMSSFSGCTRLQKVTLGNKVRSIGNDAFSSCKRLSEINIPATVTELGSGTFSGCESLTSITIPDLVTGINDSTFYNCSALTDVEIGKAVTLIGRNAFYGCKCLESIVIGSSVTSLGEGAFSNCTGLKSVKIPESVTSIGQRAFHYCTKLKHVTIPDSVTNIGSYAFGFIEFKINEKIPDFIICGYADSEAQWYAEENGFNFVLIDSIATTLSGSITSYVDDSDITVKLTGVDNNFTAETKGKGDYSIANVPAGEYTLTVSKDNHVTREYTVTVAYKDISKDVKLCPKGDVNGDGETDIMDCSVAQRYIRELTTLDAYQIACGDVSGTGDGELDIQDVSRILRHIRELAMLY